MLHPVPVPEGGPRFYCGPMSICAVTGMHPSEVLPVVQRIQGITAPVHAMSDFDMCAVMGYLGWGLRAWEPAARFRPFPAYLRTLGKDTHIEIISFRNHFTAIDYTHQVDTLTYGRVVPLSEGVRMSSIIDYVFEVRRVAYRRTRRSA